MKTIFKILLALLCSCALPVQGQNSYIPVMPDIIPPSPTSRVFQKFLGYPISHATGTIDINIPLYTLETNGLSIPLALKYHSSGVRAQDPVGAVGQNWALFPGFKISRTIISKPDEVYPVTNKGYYPSVEDQIYLASPLSRDCECSNMHGRIYPKMDGQYDIFQLSMSGMTASFILQRVNGVDVVKQIPESPLKITPKLDNSTNYIDTRLYGFEIQDDKGIRYVFGEASPVHGTSTNFVERQPTGGYFSGWMLREIIFPDNTKITFTYQSIREDVPAFNYNATILDNGTPMGIAGCFWDNMEDWETGSNSPYWRILGSDGYRKIYGNDLPYAYINTSVVPSTIVSPNATISFTYLADKLASLTVKQTTGEQLKKVQLSYDTSTKNLLKKVDITGEGYYQLNYKNEGLMKNSGFDWWGYYNGAPHHETNLPSITLPVLKTNGFFGNEVSMSLGDNANRTPNANYMDTHSLIEVISPTKGKLKINYEPHCFTLGGVDKIGGGLRVKSTELYDPISEKTIVKSYVYEGANYLGHDYPDAKSMVSTRYICPLDDGTCTVRQRTLSVFANYPYLRGNTNAVWYSKIAEIAINKWKKEYEYQFNPDEYENVLSHDFPLNPELHISEVNSMLYPAPWLVSETVFDDLLACYEKKEETKYTYSSSHEFTGGMVAIPYQFPLGGYSNCQFLEEKTSCPSHTYVDVYGSPIKCCGYYVKAGTHHLVSTQKTTYCSFTDYYEGGDSIVENINYEYDTQRPYNVSVKRTSLSGGDEQVEKYYYSNNTIPDKGTLTTAQQSAIALLTSRNYLTTPVQQTLEKGNARLYSVLKGYSNSLSPAMEVQNEYFQQGSGLFTNRITYDKYDSYRNPIHISKDNQEHIVYVWSYKGQYPVAEIKGATYEEVQAALGCTPESLSAAATPNMALINGLRQKLASALITTYTHKPMVGVTAITVPNGTTTTFEYNSEGKLLRVKDQNGKTVEEYQYNFRP